jgi:hypothetical protein
MQFAFKQNYSTIQCSFVVNEILQYYANNSTPVNIILLDASKAFDKVHYVKLFRLLNNRGVCPLVIRFLINSYTKQSVNVNWNGCSSRNINATNGVKQCGVLSRILFTIYFDELLKSLEASGVGCHIGNKFMGAVAYADDVVLLVQTKTAAKVMLSIANKFAKEYNVSFNPSKTEHVFFTTDDQVKCNIKFDESDIACSKHATHLGILIGVSCNGENITKCTNNCIGRFNELR